MSTKSKKVTRIIQIVAAVLIAAFAGLSAGCAEKMPVVRVPSGGMEQPAPGQ
ncbi:MAG: hypothetical protein ACLPXZ_29685 [Mycobacterium sp.]